MWLYVSDVTCLLLELVSIQFSVKESPNKAAQGTAESVPAILGNTGRLFEKVNLVEMKDVLGDFKHCSSQTKDYELTAFFQVFIKLYRISIR